jgi:transposase-like protein
METTRLEICESIPSDGICADCGLPAQVVITIRKWKDDTANHISHPLCVTCAAPYSAKLSKLLKDTAPEVWKREIVDLLQTGQKINACRLYLRHHIGRTLREAKDAVDRLQAELKG